MSRTTTCTLNPIRYSKSMIDPRIIEHDPAWLPHALDAQKRTVEFIKVPRTTLGDRGFLADRDPGPSDRAVLSWDQVQAMAPSAAPLHLIAHSAFCRSTLLVRAVDTPGVAAPLNEPGILASLVNAGEAAREMITPIMALLSRQHADGETVIVKPTNHANMIVPVILRSVPNSSAVLMTNGMPAFLRAVARRGLMGRNWGRKLFLELQSYAGMNFGMDPKDSFALTDLQAAGLAWFLNQRFFTLIAEGQVQGIDRARIAVLDGDRFDVERERTIGAVFQHFRINAPTGLAAALANGDVFHQHAKLGGSFAAYGTEQRDHLTEQEIDQVGEWIALIAAQAGVTVPVAQTLF